MTTKHFTASVTFRFRNAAGELETRTVSQDVTDDIATGAEEEHLVDNVYWKQVANSFQDVEILGGGVSAE